jgi:hypothetical protein
MSIRRVVLNGKIHEIVAQKNENTAEGEQPFICAAVRWLHEEVG